MARTITAPRANCHPDRAHAAHGMCGPCFYAQPAQRERRRNHATTHTPAVYFIACGDLDLVKIGTTVSLHTRLRHMRAGSPAPLELLFCIPGTRTEERTLHKRFTSARSHGEWYSLSQIWDDLLGLSNRGDRDMTAQYGPWVQTYTGRAFDLLDPKPEQIDILDVAHALSNLCRFTGHVREFYSVAQHSCLVAQIVHDLWRGEHAAPCQDVVSLAALLHDAAEAYAGDISTPLKRALRGEGQLSEYDVIEERIHARIAERFGVDQVRRGFAHLIKRADMIALATEHAALFDGPPPRPWGFDLPQPWPYKIEPWAPAMAQVQFLQAFSFYGGA